MKRATLVTGATALAILAGSVAAYADQRGPGMRMGARMNFEEIDANGDGKVTMEEIRAHAQARFDEVDANGDGSITPDEMVAHREAQFAARAEERRARMMKGAERMMERRDADSSGGLSIDEIGPRDGGAQMFSRLDTDGDGAISAEEFAAARDAMEKRRAEHRKDKGGEHRGPRSGENDG